MILSSHLDVWQTSQIQHVQTRQWCAGEEPIDNLPAILQAGRLCISSVNLAIIGAFTVEIFYCYKPGCSINSCWLLNMHGYSTDPNTLDFADNNTSFPAHTSHPFPNLRLSHSPKPSSNSRPPVVNQYLARESRRLHREKTVSSINGAGEVEYSHTKEWTGLLPYITQKN